ncbi:tRNA (adenine(22)-N(1))-methyltransferase TrmK [Ureibacillus sp. FSL K6-8385]|uniref:tRNA (Adenine-N(1))-methyltransferase n=1 Tax=Ureibacillus terrenus TaxID=118246 RepID=A0A540V4T9_9BACL|nr:tRNA (adenine(22)-N(1))-methyltransferase TrmK [Ureibacillus terrenus]MED3661543.1 tRNA (adenine(22)-N(1))-methyltransferase TrmK [Ureibacillus terrenus]MED3764011.1 tRNA (adenine(22)-N(1))-methyltransferase TrmK [Ureibacillus terrenus]TQE91771.1 tRNA (adenine-N(1))-methyltransferase [Ureibacillus terrenus]
MNAQNLSKRLEKVASFVPKGAIVADIGSDHAYLPCYLVHNGISPKAIAGEVVKGPYQSAVKKVREEGLEHLITVRLADGLEAIEDGDQVDAITIAGMGGPLIVSILEKNPDKLNSVTRLILQPNTHAKVIREWALEHQWRILDEAIVEEDQKIYEIIVLERGPMELSEAEILMGKKLIQEKSEVFLKKWTHEVKHWKQVLKSLEKAEQTPEIEEKRRQILHQIALVEEVIQT